MDEEKPCGEGCNCGYGQDYLGKCIFCEKDMTGIADTFQPDDGGEVRINFSYGSRHDQELDMKGCGFHIHHVIELSETRLQKLLCCEKIVGYVCDDCFEKKQHLFSGYETSRPKPTNRKIV